MGYSCTDFTDSILDALQIDVPQESLDSPADQADLALDEIARLQKAAKELAMFASGAADKIERIKRGLQYLRLARACFGDCPQTVKKVRRALKSGEGALRNARCKESRGGQHAVD